MQDLDPYRPPAADVVEQVPAERRRPLASRGVRLAAELLNNAFLVLACVPFFFGAIADAGTEVFGNDSSSVGVAGIVVSGVLVVGLTVVQLMQLHRHRWSLGKRILGIRIVRSDYSEISFGRLLGLRIVVPLLIGGLLSCFSVIDALFIFGEKRRCLHDYIADTIVVEA